MFSQKTRLASVSIVAISLLLAPQVYSQEAVDEVFFEKEMEARLSRDIQSYLGNDRFIIGVDFKTTGPRGPGGEDNVVVREIRTPLPGLPKASETFRKEIPVEELNELNQNLQLEDQVGSRGGLVDGESVNAFTGSGTEVYLVLDTSVNSVQEDFIRDLIQRKLALDVNGGDAMQVVRSDFSKNAAAPVAAPQQQNGGRDSGPSYLPFPQYLPFQQPAQQAQANAAANPDQNPAPQAAEVETPEEREERIAKAIQEAANSAAEAVSQANREALVSLQEQEGSFIEENWWLLVLAAVLLLLFFALMVLFSRRSQQIVQPAPYAAPPIVTSSAATESVNESKSASATGGFAGIRRELATVGLSAPHAVRSEMDALMAQNRLDLIAPSYRVLGHNLFESLFGEVPSEKQSEFNEYIAERDMSNTQIEAQAQDLYARLLRAAGDDGDGSRSQAFRFLDKLHVSQILTLIKNEKARVQALVISQLQNRKASEVLKSLDPKQRVDVVHELSQFETFPVETFRDVASNLARKVQKIPAIENISTDGVSILIGLLDNMTSIEEGRILSELENKNPDLYLKVKKEYFTFQDLARAPQKVMGEALLDLDKDVLSRSLLGANDAITRRVLGSLPKRLADSVKEEMTLHKGKVNSDQIQEDRKVLLMIMRGLVREGKINMDKI